MTREEKNEFDRVIDEARELQHRLPWLELVAVGGTAAAIHARHRYSLDSDQVTLALIDHYEEALDELEHWPDWQTNRTSRPVLILGARHGVELGLRQQRRPIPLETVEVDDLVVPTATEILRIKAYLVYHRRATRDYLDVAALTDVLGQERALDALKWLNVLYEGEGNQTAITKFADAVQQKPLDLERVALSSYRGIVHPYDDWEYVERRCREIGEALFLLEMEGQIPTRSEDFRAENDAPTREREGEDRRKGRGRSR